MRDRKRLLDGLGNFATFQEDSDGQGWDLDQERDVNAANEITGIDEGQYQAAWLTPEYDAAGNMIVGPRADAPGTAQFYVYDAWNRLAKVFADTDENGEFDDEEDDLVAAYRYDGRNRRIEKVLTEAAGEPGSVEYLHNHAWQVLEERVFDDEQELERVYQNVWSPRYIDSMILRDECDPTTGGILLPARLFYLADANYNVTGLLREDPQTPGAWQVVERYVYDPYGRVTYLDADFAALAPQQSAHDNTTLYTGRTLDRESGLMHYRARYYELLLSTFTTRDPLGYAAGDVNLYRYVGNRPIQATDPNGLETYILNIVIFAPRKPISEPSQAEIRRIWNSVARTLTRDTVILLIETQETRAIFDNVVAGPYYDDCGLVGWKLKGRENYQLNDMGQGGGDSYRGSWHPERLVAGVEDSKKGMAMVKAAVVAHELIYHGLVGSTHDTLNGFIDSKTPKVGTEFCPEAITKIKAALGIQ